MDAEPVDVSQGEPEPTWPEPAATQIEPEPSIAEISADAVDGDDMSDTKQEQELVEMLTVLRMYLGNRTTSGQWCKQMLTYGGPGWSKPSFKRRLKILKYRRWIQIVGKPDADLERAPEGSYFEVTPFAPVAPGQPGSDRDVGVNGAADAAVKAAMELLQRLNRGKPAA